MPLRCFEKGIPLLLWHNTLLSKPIRQRSRGGQSNTRSRLSTRTTVTRTGRIWWMFMRSYGFGNER